MNPIARMRVRSALAGLSASPACKLASALRKVAATSLPAALIGKSAPLPLPGSTTLAAGKSLPAALGKPKSLSPPKSLAAAKTGIPGAGRPMTKRVPSRGTMLGREPTQSWGAPEGFDSAFEHMPDFASVPAAPKLPTTLKPNTTMPPGLPALPNTGGATIGKSQFMPGLEETLARGAAGKGQWVGRPGQGASQLLMDDAVQGSGMSRDVAKALARGRAGFGNTPNSTAIGDTLAQGAPARKSPTPREYPVGRGVKPPPGNAKPKPKTAPAATTAAAPEAATAGAGNNYLGGLAALLGVGGAIGLGSMDSRGSDEPKTAHARARRLIKRALSCR